VKIRSRKFEGRCARHKRYNPAVDGLGGIRGGCSRCQLLHDIWDTSMRLNTLIRRFDPAYDDVQKPRVVPGPDPRQMTLI
jgi:hypothetical protein